jgi:PQQ-dependent dehydrogenase (s-GDH family)
MIRARNIFLVLLLLCVLASGCMPTAATPPEPNQATDERATSISNPPATSVSSPTGEPATSTSSPPATSVSSPTSEPATSTSNLLATGISGPSQETFAFRVLTTGFSHPWDIAFGPDGYLWITERTGKQVTRVDPSDGSQYVALTIPEVYQAAPQDGVLGLAFHPELLKGTGNDYIYIAYSYNAAKDPAVDRRIKIRRYSYDTAKQTLGNPVDLITNLPASTDHNSGRLVFGADQKLYYTIGDQGGNQFDLFCQPIPAQKLPTAAEVSAHDWSKYPGKVLRLNLDGTIPSDNPRFAGVQSHIYSYGHRNVQGLVSGPDGKLYASEHGPKTDDEVNLIQAGKNYGWPYVAGYQDDQAYVYGNWSAAATPPGCAGLRYSDFAIPASVPQQKESAWSDPDFTPPLKTFFTVPNGYKFFNPACGQNNYICWPTVAPSGMDIYTPRPGGMPGWSTSLLMTSLKRGTVYRMELSADGRSIRGDAIPYFKTTNRYRDIAINPDGLTFYVITDNDLPTLDPSGVPTEALENPGAILEFRYTGRQ